MRFKTEFSDAINMSSRLTYNPKEFAFSFQPKEPYDYYLTLNSLTLGVNLPSGVVEVDGYCPLNWAIYNHSVPSFKQGRWMVTDEKEAGFVYRINSEDWPVYANEKTGWVCIGDPANKTTGLEFATNCVAIIENENLAALWLKPE